MVNISEVGQPLMKVSPTPFCGWPFSEHLILAQNMGELADIRHSGIVVEGDSSRRLATYTVGKIAGTRSKQKFDTLVI